MLSNFGVTGNNARFEVPALLLVEIQVFLMTYFCCNLSRDVSIIIVQWCIGLHNNNNTLQTWMYMSFTHLKRQLQSRKRNELARGSYQVPITREFECVSNKQCSSPLRWQHSRKLESSSALLAKHITSQEQINTNFEFGIVSYMPFPPRKAISEQNTCIEMNIKSARMGGGRGVSLPGCSYPPCKLKLNKTQIF